MARRFLLPADDPELCQRYRLPTERGILSRDYLVTNETALASRNLLLALLSYGMRHGLPNIPPRDCEQLHQKVLLR